MTAEPAPAFEVLDVLGLCRLERRSPTLDGSVPLRVAQACVPFLEGNAFGFQLTWTRPLELRRRLGRPALHALQDREALERLLRASLPMLEAEGLLPAGSAWRPLLGQGLVAGRSPVTVFTGLLVRPRPGVRLRLSGTRNRRSRAFEVREAVVEDCQRFTPLLLHLEPREDAVTLLDEVATLAALPGRVALGRRPMEAAPEVVAAHLAFYDQAYFDAKRRGEVSRRYRQELDPGPAPPPPAEVALEVVEAGPSSVEAAAPAAVHGPEGPRPGGAADRLTVRNAVGLALAYDGLHLTVTPDPAGLAAHARAVQQRWAPALERAGAAGFPGAVLYLSKYVTPHPPGEPHFFVKPCALFRTPPGISLLLEGVTGPGWETLRGVVESDHFHAAPAVFLVQPGRAEVPVGAALGQLLPVSRELLARPFALRRVGPLAALASSPGAGGA